MMTDSKPKRIIPLSSSEKKTPIDVDGICSIIKIARTYQVKKIRLKDMEIEFEGSTEQTVTHLSSMQVEPQYTLNEHGQISPVLQKPTATDKAVQETSDILGRDAMLAQMDIEDPYEYEQFLLSEGSEKDFVNGVEKTNVG